MKLEKGLTFLFGTLLGAALPLGGIFCLATGFDLSLYSSAQLTLLCLGLSAIVAAVSLSRFRRKWVLLLAATAFFALVAHLCAGNWLSYLFSQITRTYHSAYGFPIFPNIIYTPYMLEQGSMTWALFFVSIPGCALTTLTLCRRWRCFAALGLDLLPVAACVVVTNTVPASWALYLFLASLMLLLLTQGVRRREEKAGTRLIALLLVPCLLCPWLLLAAVPQEGYRVSTNSLFQSAVQWLQEHFSLGNSGSQGGAPTLETEIDLREVGPLRQTNTKVLTLTSSYTDLIYLRGQSYDTFIGNGWKQTSLTPERNGWAGQGIRRAGELTIQTQKPLPFRYFSYYHTQVRLHFPYTGGCLRNDSLADTYTVFVMKPSKDFSISQAQQLSQDQYARYTALPSSTATWATPLVAQLGAQDAQSIAEYVRTLVPYDLNTPAMPPNQWDFAQWFYREAPSGYCVHYATLTTVLLRAAGIPARYVTGYAVYAEAGIPVEVSSDYSHAWVEYFSEEYGWQPLDPTPSAGLLLPPSATTPTDPTQPSSDTTQPSSGTTRPSTDTTQPSSGNQPDRPSQSSSVPLLSRPNDASTPTAPEQPLDLGWLFTLLKVLGLLAVIVLAVLGQYLLRLRHRRRKCHTGPVNSQALARWREVLQLCRLLMLPEPEALLALAEKARFSQHTLTKAELRQFDVWIRQARQSLGPRHLLLRLIFAL